jgi:hypothetical protein
MIPIEGRKVATIIIQNGNYERSGTSVEGSFYTVNILQIYIFRIYPKSLLIYGLKEIILTSEGLWKDNSKIVTERKKLPVHLKHRKNHS